MVIQTTLIEILLSITCYCRILSISVQEEFLTHKACLDLFNQTYCNNELFSSNINKSVVIDNQNLVQKRASKWGIYLSLAEYGPSLLVTLIFGVCSDKIGRKTFLLLPIIGFAISSGTFAIISNYDASPIYYLYVGKLIGSLFGGFFSLLSSCFAYIADLTNKNNRTRRITIAEALVSLSGVIASLSGGLIIKNFGFVYVYVFTCGLYILVMFYWYFIKETRLGISDRKFLINEVFGDTGIKKQFQLLLHNDKSVGRCVIIAFLAFFLLIFCFATILLSSYKKLLHEPLNFNPTFIGYYTAAFTGCLWISGFVTSCLCITRLKWKDNTVLLMGNLGIAALFVSLGLSSTTLGMFLSLLWSLLLGGAISSLRSMISKIYDQADQGKVCALIAFVESLSNFCSNILVNYLYEKTLSISSSFVLFILAGVAGVLVILSILLIIFRVTDKYQILAEEELNESEEDYNTIT